MFYHQIDQFRSLWQDACKRRQAAFDALISLTYSDPRNTEFTARYHAIGRECISLRQQMNDLMESRQQRRVEGLIEVAPRQSELF